MHYIIQMDIVNGIMKLDGNCIWLHSTFEVRVAKILDKLNIHWKYEPKKFIIENHVYIPDFLINDSIWWEVKGWMQENDKIKLQKFSSLYPEEQIKVIYLEQIEQLECLDDNFSYDIINKLGIDIECI